MIARYSLDRDQSTTKPRALRATIRDRFAAVVYDISSEYWPTLALATHLRPRPHSLLGLRPRLVPPPRLDVSAVAGIPAS